MALFEALGQLVGAALLTAAPACDIHAVPADDAAKIFPVWLKAHGETATLDAIVDALAREIWVGAETRGLTQQALEHHAQAIAGLLSSYPPQSSALAQAIERGRAAGPPHSEPVARRIAVDIFARARSAGAIAAAGLKDDVTLFMVDRVYAHLIDEAKALIKLTPALREFVEGKSEKLTESNASPKTGLATLGLSAALTHHLSLAGGPALLADLRERYSLSEKAIGAVLTLLERQAVQPAELVPRLEELTAWLGDVRAQLLKASNEDADVRRFKSKAAAALADGDFDAAAEALKQVRREVREGRRRIEERLSDEVASLKSQMLEEARSTARLAELAMAAQEYAAAADLFGEAALALPTADRDGAWRFNLQRADALVRRSESGEHTLSLTEAITAYGHLLRSASESANQKSIGQASLGLAHAMALAGTRDSGTTRLKDSAAAYRKAISLLVREADTRIWAQAQLRLARVLALIGERDQLPAILRESAQAYRDALKEYRAERAADHAGAQMGLGNVLLTLEEKEPGTPLLVEAADAYSGALSVLSRTADAALWADAQMNLGIARLGIGEQQGGADRLEGAVEAFRSALEVSTRDASPQKWALIQLNLGNALAALGDRDRGSPRQIEEALAAYSAALEVFQRDSQPMKWAIAQMNLGTALIRVGEHRDKRRNWLAAAGALVPALEVFEIEGATTYADVTRRNLHRFQESWDNLLTAPTPAAKLAATPHAAPKPRLSKTA